MQAGTQGPWPDKLFHRSALLARGLHSWLSLYEALGTELLGASAESSLWGVGEERVNFEGTLSHSVPSVVSLLTLPHLAIFSPSPTPSSIPESMNLPKTLTGVPFSEGNETGGSLPFLQL